MGEEPESVKLVGRVAGVVGVSGLSEPGYNGGRAGRAGRRRGRLTCSFIYLSHLKAWVFREGWRIF